MVAHFVGVFNTDVAGHYQMQVHEPFSARTPAANGMEID
jgi:hypothetical protein